MPDQIVLEHYHQMPIVELPHAFCHQHWHEFERLLPRRALAVMSFKLWEQLVADEAFVKAIGCWKEPPAQWDWPTDFSLMNETMRAEPYSPWCCYIGADRREKAWENTPFLDVAKES